MKRIIKNKSSGFTIVELLIVIVVIAILAAITIVSYTGMQVRARDSARISLIKDIEKALELYKAVEGSYPPVVDAQSSETSCGTPGKDWGHCDRLKELQDELAPYATIDIISLSDKGYVSRELSDGKINFLYTALKSEKYQTYGMAIKMEGEGGKTDNGIFDNYYEVGPKVQYCKERYTGAAADWTDWSHYCAATNPDKPGYIGP